MKGLQLAKRAQELVQEGVSVQEIAQKHNCTIVVIHNYLHVMRLSDYSITLIHKKVVSISTVVILIIKTKYDYARCNEILYDLSALYDKISQKHVIARLNGGTATVIEMSAERIYEDWVSSIKTKDKGDSILIKCSKSQWRKFTERMNQRISNLKT